MEKNILTINYNILADMITETVKHNLLTEKRNVQSKILSDLIKKHGKPIYKEADINAIIDDEIVDVVNYYDIKKPNPYCVIRFEDGVCLLVKKTQNNQEYLNKFDKRFHDHNYKTDGKYRYTWHNSDAEEMIFKNPWFKEWSKEHQRKALDNVKNGRKYNHDFYPED